MVALRPSSKTATFGRCVSVWRTLTVASAVVS
jgi:hypothetical protein